MLGLWMLFRRGGMVRRGGGARRLVGGELGGEAWAGGGRMDEQVELGLWLRLMLKLKGGGRAVRSVGGE
jgi:hypothetical protein